MSCSIRDPSPRCPNVFEQAIERSFEGSASRRVNPDVASISAHSTFVIPAKPVPESSSRGAGIRAVQGMDARLSQMPLEERGHDRI